jgi:hypothetical protein
MLGKLIKYELKATSRIMLPMYALLFVLALINKVFIIINLDSMKVPMIIAMTVYGFLFVAIFIMTLVVTIQRFNKNLLTDEGYLSFTLPVQVHSHVDCKMIVSLIWFVLSGIVAVASLIVMAIDRNALMNWQRFIAECADAFRQIGAHGGILTLEMILLLLLSVLYFTVRIYVAMTIGNMSSKHKLLAGVGVYLGCGIVERIVAVSPGSNGWAESLLEGAKTIQAGVHAAETFMLLIILYTLLFGAIYYVLTNWILKNKLNLE